MRGKSRQKWLRVAPTTKRTWLLDAADILGAKEAQQRQKRRSSGTGRRRTGREGSPSTGSPEPRRCGSSGACWRSGITSYTTSRKMPCTRARAPRGSGASGPRGGSWPSTGSATRSRPPACPRARTRSWAGLTFWGRCRTLACGPKRRQGRGQAESGQGATAAGLAGGVDGDEDEEEGKGGLAVLLAAEKREREARGRERRRREEEEEAKLRVDIDFKVAVHRRHYERAIYPERAAELSAREAAQFETEAMRARARAKEKREANTLCSPAPAPAAPAAALPGPPRLTAPPTAGA